MYLHCMQGRNRKCSFWRGKVIFRDFFSRHEMLFPGRKFPFWLTQNKFQWFLIVKSKKKKKKKKKNSPLFILYLFLLTFSIFHLPFFNFPSFPHFHFFFLASLFPVGQQKFPGQKSLGDTLPPPPRLLRHCSTELNRHPNISSLWPYNIWHPEGYSPANGIRVHAALRPPFHALLTVP